MKRERLAQGNLSLVDDKNTVQISEVELKAQEEKRKKAVDKKKQEKGLLSYRNVKYDTSMCKRVVELMEEGMSRYEVAHELKVVTATLEAWEKRYEEFAEALHLGDEASRAWWEKQARVNLVMSGTAKFNMQLWTFNMKNRFYWADKVEKEEKSVVQEVIERKEEIEKQYDEEHTAEVLDILKGIGAIKSAVGKSTETEDDKVHQANSNA